MKFKAGLYKGPLRRSSPLLVGVAMRNINKKEVEWMKFWACGRGHGEKLAHGVVASGSNFGGVQEAGRLSGIGANKKLMELSHIFISEELVIFRFFKSTAAAWTSAIPAAVSFFVLY